MTQPIFRTLPIFVFAMNCLELAELAMRWYGVWANSVCEFGWTRISYECVTCLPLKW